MPVIESYSKPISSSVVSQVWVPQADIHFALAMLLHYMATQGISEFTVADDRGGSGHFWIRVDADEMTPAQLDKVLAKKFDISKEDR